MRFEFYLGLDFVINETSFKQFYDNVERIVRFKDLMETHTVRMVQTPHYFYFFDETFLSFVFAIGCLFGKGFHCKVLASLNLFSQVD